MTILDTIENAGRKLIDNLADLHLHLNYGLEAYPDTELWYDKVLNAGEKVTDAVLSVPKYLKYILFGAGVLAIVYVVFKIIKK